MDEFRIAIIGAGAIGGHFAGEVGRNGVRPEHVVPTTVMEQLHDALLPPVERKRLPHGQVSVSQGGGHS